MGAEKERNREGGNTEREREKGGGGLRELQRAR